MSSVSLLPYSTEISRSPGDAAIAAYQYKPSFPSSDLPTSEPDIDDYPTPRPLNRNLKRDFTAFSDDDDLSASQNANPAAFRHNKKRFPQARPPLFNPMTYQLDCARRKIRQAIDQSKICVDLQHMNLTSLPSEIADLRHIVSTSQSGSFTTNLELYLADNRLTALPECLFTITNLTFLGVSNNKLESLSPSILKLQNLKTLNISVNNIDFLPANLLKLKTLETLLFNSARIEPSRRVSQTRPHLHLEEQPKTITLTRAPDRYSRVPSLYETAMRVVATHDYWSELSDDYLDDAGLSTKAIDTLRNTTPCDECGTVVCNLYATREEKWSGFAMTVGLPIRRNVCSLNCLEKAPSFTTE